MAEIQIYIQRAGQQLGPYSQEDIAARVRAGRLSGDDLAWHEGCAAWAPLFTLPGVALPAPPQAPGLPPLVAPPDAACSHSEILGYALLAVPMVAGFLIWQTGNTGLAWAAIVATAAMGGIEAKRLGIGSATDRTAKGRKRSGPGAWTAGILLLWIFCFPAYLYWRSRYGARNLLLPASIVALAFLASPFLAEPELPAVDDPMVIKTAEDAIRESPILKFTGDFVGPITISNPGEISYDRRQQKRVARAELKTNLGTEVIYYTVEWQNRSKDLIWVQIQDQP